MTPIPPDTSKDKTIPQMQLTEHFTLADLCYSDTAVRNNINNVLYNIIDKKQKYA